MLKVGDKFIENFVVSEKVYEGFIELFHDDNKLHINDEFARSKGFKMKVSHGNILNGFLSYFIGKCLPSEEVIIHSQQIQYKNPVYPGDQLSFNGEVIETYESVNTIVFKYTFANDMNKTVAKGKIQIGLLI